MSRDPDATLVGKLKLALGLKAAELGMPKSIDPKRAMRWINNPEALARKMDGLLQFLDEEPETSIENDVICVETTMTKMSPMRTADKYLSEFSQNGIEVDPFFDLDFLTSEIRPIGRQPVLITLTAICLCKEASADEADSALSEIAGCIPLSFGQLAESALNVPGFLKHLGLVVATGGKFNHTGSVMVPYLAVRREQKENLKFSAGHFDRPWPANTWFLGISPIT